MKCDLCEKQIKNTLTRWQDYHFNHNGYLVYCRDCIEKLNLTKEQAKKDKIYIK